MFNASGLRGLTFFVVLLFCSCLGTGYSLRTSTCMVSSGLSHYLELIPYPFFRIPSFLVRICCIESRYPKKRVVGFLITIESESSS